MSDSSEDETELPSGDECKRRCEEFANVTGTNSALAMFFLQNVKWDLQAAINYYFEKNGGAPAPSPSPSNNLKRKKEPEPSTADTSQSAKRRSSEEPLLQKAAKNEDKRIRMLSWNIDGLDTNNLKTRTRFICQLIANENPHIVFLQEVVPESLIILKEQCPGYRITVTGIVGYFTAVLLKESVLKFESEDIQPFFSSVMSRSLILIECKIKDVSFLLINTHLESMTNHSAERKRQLKIGFQKVQEAEDSRTVIFGGDLNMREKELTDVGLPSRVVDVWSATGERPEARYTWDMSRNDNKGFEGKFRPKCRFDRIYLRQSKKESSVKPVYFELVGLERIPKCQRFASDHWGLLVHFDIKV